MITEVIRNGAFRDDPRIREAITDLVNASYEDPTSLITREFDHCDTLYIGKDEDGKLLTFFLVGWEELTVDGNGLQAVYLGLSAIRQDHKNTGLVRDLYSLFLSEARQWEQTNEIRLLLWGTLATPSTFLGIHTLFAEAEPYNDGTWSKRGLRVAKALSARMNVAAQPETMHPFVLKNIAEGTRYSQPEVERINRIIDKNNFTLFADVGLDEHQGDRLLFICQVA